MCRQSNRLPVRIVIGVEKRQVVGLLVTLSHSALAFVSSWLIALPSHRSPTSLPESGRAFVSVTTQNAVNHALIIGRPGNARRRSA